MSTAEKRVYNFSAGPAVLPMSVLQKAQEHLLCLPGAGASILEISHRSKPFIEILDHAIANLTKLLNVPDTHKIVFLQGGSRLQFSMIPMNFLKGSNQTADYILTGAWGKKAYAEAKKEGETNVAWNGGDEGFNRLPKDEELQLSSNSAYTYFTSNETIEGVQFSGEPNVGDSPLICDTSSDFLHRPLPIANYGMVYACAQKNAGPAGVTVAIIREDLLDRASDTLPGYCDYRQHVNNGSMYNTPPTFSIYLMNLVFEWLLNDVGGLEKMHSANKEKAAILYNAIDASHGFYAGHAHPSSRSLMNVTFRLPNDELQDKFVAEAAKNDLSSLKGHRSVGGIRASIYNAMPIEGVTLLGQFMTEFCQANA
ncbi:MAG: 3-phosphoserine/phosphohydroxythreonine transaminase [Planctomycetales bacterium]|nr:3-phosphoserine/phosphohydroxythreonine transaminase [Planctomycetales bacterium]